MRFVIICLLLGLVQQVYAYDITGQIVDRDTARNKIRQAEHDHTPQRERPVSRLFQNAAHRLFLAQHFKINDKLVDAVFFVGIEHHIVQLHALSVTQYGQVRLPLLGTGELIDDIICDKAAPSVYRNDGVSHLQAGLLCGRTLVKFRYGARADELLRTHHANKDHKTQKEVHHSARHGDKDSVSHRGLCKGTRLFALLVLALHTDKAADGKQAQAVFCSPAGEAEQRRPHAQREFVHLDAAELRSEEMPQLMNENHNAEYEYRRQHRNEKRPRAAEK